MILFASLLALCGFLLAVIGALTEPILSLVGLPFALAACIAIRRFQ